jgi:hypothetical protein
MNSQHRPIIPLLILSVCLIILALSGFAGGYEMLREPNGAPMGMPISVLEGTLFENYFVPGLLLIGIWGCGSVVTLIGLWLGPRWLHLSVLHEHWAWLFSVLLGLGLLVWLTYQVVTIPAIAPIQIILYGLACFLLTLPLFPPMRRYYWIEA